MAATKTLSSTALTMEVENGTNSKGEPTYAKKTFSGIKANADENDIFEVAQAIKAILKANTHNYYLIETSVLH